MGKLFCCWAAFQRAHHRDPEELIIYDKRIQSAIMFGRDHIEPGVLIQPAADYILTEGNAEKRRDFIELIWYARSLYEICSYLIDVRLALGLQLNTPMHTSLPTLVST